VLLALTYVSLLFKQRLNWNEKAGLHDMMSERAGSGPELV